jgi:hypothetical protein
MEEAISKHETFQVELLNPEFQKSDGKVRAVSGDLFNHSFGRHSFGLDYLFGDGDNVSIVHPDESKFAQHTFNTPILTIFLLLNTMIGSGILNQPQVFLEAGVVPASVMLVVTAFFTWLGLAALIDTGVAYEKFDFSDLALFAFGKWGENLVDVCIAIGNFGAVLVLNSGAVNIYILLSLYWCV